MDLPKVNIDILRTVPMAQKAMILAIVLGVIGLVFYYYVVEPKNMELEHLNNVVQASDAEIQKLTIKVKHLDELIAASEQLEIELAKKKERLPPKEEAVMLLKQVTDLGIRLGLDIKLWKPGKQLMGASNLFVKMPVNVEVAGGYHTVTIFFDRIAKMPRIIDVSNMRMGAPKVQEGRTVIKTVFDLTAFAAP